METVCGLVHVVIGVESASIKGITSLVGNSPNLLTCVVGAEHFVTDNGELERSSIKRVYNRSLSVGNCSLQGGSL